MAANNNGFVVVHTTALLALPGRARDRRPVIALTNFCARSAMETAAQLLLPRRLRTATLTKNVKASIFLSFTIEIRTNIAHTHLLVLY